MNPTLAETPEHPSGLFPWRGWLGIAVLVPIGLLAVLSGRYFAEGSAPDILLDILGWSTLATGLWIRTWATFYLGGRKNLQLVTGGPYGLCRNPLYLGSLLIGLSLGFLLENLTFTLAFLTVAPRIYLPVIQEEERILSRRHGSAFAAYAASVPRLIPRRLSPPGPAPRELLVDMRAMRAHARRTAVTLLIVPLLEWVADFQTHGVIPHFLRLP